MNSGYKALITQVMNKILTLLLFCVVVFPVYDDIPLYCVKEKLKWIEDLNVSPFLLANQSTKNWEKGEQEKSKFIINDYITKSIEKLVL